MDFAPRYFAPRYFAPRYFRTKQPGAAAGAVPFIGGGLPILVKPPARIYRHSGQGVLRWDGAAITARTWEYRATGGMQMAGAAARAVALTYRQASAGGVRWGGMSISEKIEGPRPVIVDRYARARLEEELWLLAA